MHECRPCALLQAALFESLVAYPAKESQEAKVEEAHSQKSFWRSSPRAALKGEGGRRVAEHEGVFIHKFDRIEGGACVRNFQRR